MRDISLDNELANPQTYADTARVHEIYRRLRLEDPVHWSEPDGFQPFWAITKHADVVEAAVVGVPHEVLGEDVAAVVVLSPGASTTPEELREHCAAALADYKVPRRIVVVGELPRNATGKVLKARVQDQLGASVPSVSRTRT